MLGACSRTTLTCVAAASYSADSLCKIARQVKGKANYCISQCETHPDDSHRHFWPVSTPAQEQGRESNVVNWRFRAAEQKTARLVSISRKPHSLMATFAAIASGTNRRSAAVACSAGLPALSSEWRTRPHASTSNSGKPIIGSCYRWEPIIFSIRFATP
jgi:hypothetical protein